MFGSSEPYVSLKRRSVISVIIFLCSLVSCSVLSERRRRTVREMKTGVTLSTVSTLKI